MGVLVLTGRNDTLGCHVVKSLLCTIVQVLLCGRDAGHLYYGWWSVDVWLSCAVVERRRSLSDSAFVGGTCACVGED